MSSPNDPLSPLAQQLLQGHREAQGPEAAAQDRVWSRVQKSIFIAPVGAELGSAVDPGAASGLDPGSVAAMTGTKGAAGAAAGVAKTGVLSSFAAKAALVGTVGVAGVGIAKRDQVVEVLDPASMVQPAVKPAPEAASLPVKATPDLSTLQQSLPKIPPSPARTQPVKTQSAVTASPVELTPELQAQLGALSRIDRAIRGTSFADAQQGILDFRSSYPDSPFAGDLKALETVLSCRAGEASKAKAKAKLAKRMLAQPRFRRYWSRLRRACGL